MIRVVYEVGDLPKEEEVKPENGNAGQQAVVV